MFVSDSWKQLMDRVSRFVSLMVGVGGGRGVGWGFVLGGWMGAGVRVVGWGPHPTTPRSNHPTITLLKNPI